jgi:hypothetical protein
MSSIRTTVASFALLVPLAAFAACDASADRDVTGYTKASTRVTRLAEFKAWNDQLQAKPGVKAVLGAAMDKQSMVKGKCYWSVTVYSDEGSHLSRWRTFFVPVTQGAVLLENANGEPVPLRSNPTVERDGPQAARPSQ